MLFTLELLACIGAGTIGGVFFAFSSFVMKALSQLPANQGIAAMQRINVVVLNPVFLGIFMGTAAAALICIAVALLQWNPPHSSFLLAAGILYLVGCFFVTLACNVPRNERLAKLSSDSAATTDYWRTYVREWTQWNHVRTIASLASAACNAVALAFHVA